MCNCKNTKTDEAGSLHPHPPGAAPALVEGVDGQTEAHVSNAAAAAYVFFQYGCCFVSRAWASGRSLARADIATTTTSIELDQPYAQAQTPGPYSQVLAH